MLVKFAKLLFLPVRLNRLEQSGFQLNCSIYKIACVELNVVLLEN